MEIFRELVALENEALTAQAEHRHRDAVQAHGRALVRAGDLERPRLMAVLFNRLGQVLEAAGNVQDAVIAYESGLKALAGEAELDLEAVLRSLGAVGKGYGGPGDLEVPDLYREATAQDLATAEADPALPARLLINIGNAYLQQPQDAPALNAYQQALARPEIEHAPELRAHALAHVGIIERRRGNTDRAEAVLSEALDLLEAHAEPPEKRRVLAALAGIYRDRGRLDQALEAYLQALAFYAQVDDALGEGRTRAGLGRLYLEQSRFADARVAYQRAVELATQVGDEDTLWHAYWGLGRCQQVAGDFDGAAVSFRNSLDRIKARQRELRTDEGKVTFLESVQDVFGHLITVHLERADADPKAYADALAVAEEARGQALYDLMGVRRRQLHSRQAEVRPSRLRPFSERQNLAAQMAPGVSVTPMDFSPMAQMAPAIASTPPLESLLDDSLWEEDSIPLIELVETAPAIPSSVPRWPADDWTGGEEETSTTTPLARLVFHVLPDCTAVFVVTPEGEVHGHVTRLGQVELADRVAQVRRVLQVDDSPRGVFVTRDVRRVVRPQPADDYKPMLRALYTELIEPVAGALPDDGTPVVIEPHAALWLLPFAALLSSEDTWLIDRWPLLYSPSAQVLDEIRQERDYGGPKDLKALVVGNPTMPKVPRRNGLEIELKPLPGAEAEAKTIAGLFPESQTTLLLGPAADWANVVALMPQHGILHLATHGIAYAEEPLASFVALGTPEATVVKALEERLQAVRAGFVQAQLLHKLLHNAESPDGLLTARHILMLPLPADLVVLSACQTGLGKVSGDGMIGLSRAFLVAGARAVLVSQWSISDEATAALMAGFYQGYIELDDKAMALQRAMRELRSKPEYAHPRYWAPFVVIGTEA